jgi:hypothetical protein
LLAFWLDAFYVAYKKLSGDAEDLDQPSQASIGRAPKKTTMIDFFPGSDSFIHAPRRPDDGA